MTKVVHQSCFLVDLAGAHRHKTYHFVVPAVSCTIIFKRIVAVSSAAYLVHGLPLHLLDSLCSLRTFCLLLL
jgi:hypothetical protein